MSNISLFVQIRAFEKEEEAENTILTDISNTSLIGSSAHSFTNPTHLSFSSAYRSTIVLKQFLLKCDPSISLHDLQLLVEKKYISVYPTAGQLQVLCLRNSANLDLDMNDQVLDVFSQNEIVVVITKSILNSDKMKCDASVIMPVPLRPSPERMIFESPEIVKKQHDIQKMNDAVEISHSNLVSEYEDSEEIDRSESDSSKIQEPVFENETNEEDNENETEEVSSVESEDSSEESEEDSEGESGEENNEKALETTEESHKEDRIKEHVGASESQPNTAESSCEKSSERDSEPESIENENKSTVNADIEPKNEIVDFKDKLVEEELKLDEVKSDEDSSEYETDSRDSDSESETTKIESVDTKVSMASMGSDSKANKSETEDSKGSGSEESGSEESGSEESGSDSEDQSDSNKSDVESKEANSTFMSMDEQINKEMNSIMSNFSTDDEMTDASEISRKKSSLSLENIKMSLNVQPKVKPKKKSIVKRKLEPDSESSSTSDSEVEKPAKNKKRRNVYSSSLFG